MKKTLLAASVGLLTLGGTFFVSAQTVVHAQGVTLQQLVQLFIQLGIIPADKAAAAEAAVANMSSGNATSPITTTTTTVATSSVVTFSTNTATPPSTTFVANQGANNNEADGVTALIFNVTNNSSNPITLGSVQASFTIPGANDVANAYLYQGATQLSAITSLEPGVLTTFQNLNYYIPAHSTVAFTVKIDVKNVTSPFVIIPSIASVTATDQQNNPVTVLGYAAGNPLTFANTTTPIFTLASTPTISQSTNGSVTTVTANFAVNIQAVGGDFTFPSPGMFGFGIYENGVEVTPAGISPVGSFFPIPTSGVVITGLSSGQLFKLQQNNTVTIPVTATFNSGSVTSAGNYAIGIDNINYSGSSGDKQTANYMLGNTSWRTPSVYLTGAAANNNGGTLIVSPQTKQNQTVYQQQDGVDTSGLTSQDLISLQVQAVGSPITVQRIQVDLGNSPQIYTKQLAFFFLVDENGKVLAEAAANSNTIEKASSSGLSVTGPTNDYYLALSGFNYTIPDDNLSHALTVKGILVPIDTLGSIPSGTPITVSVYPNAIRGVDDMAVDQYAPLGVITNTVYVQPAQTTQVNPTITPSNQTINSDQVPTLNITVPSNTIRSQLYLACPSGVSVGPAKGLTSLNCNSYFDTTGLLNLSFFTLHNSTSQPQSVVPNYYVYLSSNPNYAIGVSANIVINPSTQPVANPLSVSCTGSGFDAGVPGVSWGSNVSGGVSPYQYSWSLSNDVSNYGEGSAQLQSWMVNYSSAGTKSAQLRVTDSSGNIASASCTGIITAPQTTTQTNTQTNTQHSLAITNPNGGTYQAGSQLTIQWTTSGLTTANNSLGLNVYETSLPPSRSVLSASVGDPVSNGQVSSSGSYTWTIPSNTAPASDYVVYLSNANSYVQSSPFTITAPQTSVPAVPLSSMPITVSPQIQTLPSVPFVGPIQNPAPAAAVSPATPAITSTQTSVTPSTSDTQTTATPVSTPASVPAPVVKQTVSVSNSTVISGASVTISFTFPSTAAREQLYLSCPTGISVSGFACNQFTDVTGQSSVTITAKNSTKKALSIVPNYYIFTASGSGTGVSSNITVNPATTSFLNTLSNLGAAVIGAFHF